LRAQSLRETTPAIALISYDIDHDIMPQPLLPAMRTTVRAASEVEGGTAMKEILIRIEAGRDSLQLY
jgi:hypothetical protein